jgi:hypothetical protein
MRTSQVVSLACVLALAAGAGSACDADEEISGPTTGEIHIAVSMTGPDLDTDGLTVSVDGRPGLILATILPITIQKLAPGTHTVRLDGAADNCTVNGENPRTVTVVAGLTTTVEFALICTATTGAVRVGTALTGVDLDPNGFLAIVDDRHSLTVGVNASVTFEGIRAGSHVVSLAGVARNCAIEGLIPRTITVVAGDTVEVLFSGTCALANGTLRITAVTTGTDIDTDGYFVFGERLGTNGAVIRMVEGANYMINLTAVAVNCVVTDENPRLVTVVPGDTADVAFHVACSPVTRVAYVQGGATRAIHIVNANGTGGGFIADAANDPAWSPDGTRIAFTSDRHVLPEVYIANADGTNPLRLTAGGINSHPAWSPDGSRIAFVSQRDGNPELYVVNADGTNPVRLTNHPATDGDPAWSPDGSRIAFSSLRNGDQNIFVMNADGSGVTRLTTGGADYQPALSPDGRSLAFTRVECVGNNCFENIVVRNLDVPGERKLTMGGAPAWSPDGRHIAFTSITCSSRRIDYYEYETTCSVAGIGIVGLDGSFVGLIAVGDARNPAWQK